MKKKSLVLSLVVILLLTVLMPATAFAAKPQPVQTTGTIDTIEDTMPYDNVFLAGNSDRWRVVDRVISGELFGERYDLTYKANVDATQTGNMHGTLAAISGNYVFKINGTIQPLVPIGVSPEGYLLALLTINGHWSRFAGPGQGTFEASAVVELEPDVFGMFHVVGVDSGYFTMEGTL